MSDIIIGFDPGEVTGWSVWALDDDLPIMRLDFGLIRGGVDGVIDWVEQHLASLRPTIVICERFNPDLGDANKEYGAMEIMGVLRMACRSLSIELIFQDIGMKGMCRDEVLKRGGLWIDGPEVEHEDGRDVNDSEIHVLAWAKVSDHQPTIERFWPPLED